MVKRNRLRDGRKRAQFGADGAIMAAATLAAAGINAATTMNAAKQQAEAVTKSAETNAEALTKQNENNNTLQEQSIAFTKEQNERNRDLQKEIQMNLQLLAGQQNVNEMREAAKIQVKHGGSMRKRLKNANTLLQGRNTDNVPGITTPHNGNYIPIAYTQDGILALLTGPNHENGGVDVNILGDPSIEAEGGELMHIKYGLGGNVRRGIKDVQFISKHKLPGTDFNPKDAVLSGAMTPDESFDYQELIKRIKGISDDGKHQSTSPVRKNRPYGGLTTLPITPDLSLDFLAPVATGVVAGTRQLKCGGRHKAAYGYRYGKPPYNNMDWFPTTTKSGMTTAQGNLLGAGINAGANLLAAGIGAIGNTIAARQLAGAYGQAGNILTNAYGNLRGIDMSAINRDDFRAAHAMAALQAPIVNTGAERSAAERSLQRNLGRINRGTLSSAAAQNRSARAEVDYNDRIAQIEANADKIRQGIIQGNMERITQVSNENANRDTQANQAYAQAYLNLLQYNNDIANERITGAAQARADALLQRQSTLANMRATNAQGFANAINVGGNAFGNAFATNTKMQNVLDMALSGGTDEAVIRMALGSNGSSEYRNAARGIYERYKDGNEDQRKIANKINSLYHFA